MFDSVLSLNRLDVIAINRRRASIAVKLNSYNTTVELVADDRTGLADNSWATLRTKRAEFDPFAGLKFNLVGQKSGLSKPTEAAAALSRVGQ